MKLREAAPTAVTMALLLKWLRSVESDAAMLRLTGEEGVREIMEEGEVVVKGWEDRRKEEGERGEAARLLGSMGGMAGRKRQRDED